MGNLYVPMFGNVLSKYVCVIGVCAVVRNVDVLRRWTRLERVEAKRGASFLFACLGLNKSPIDRRTLFHRFGFVVS